MNNNIQINNDNIANYVMFKLDKIENNFSKKELENIKELVIDYNDEKDSCFIFLNELLKLPNISNLTLRNAYIYNDNYHIFLKLNNLNNITFENCRFENADLIGSLSLTSLSIINCKINNYTFLNLLPNLVELTLINENIDINIINNLNKLNYLQLSNSNIKNIENIYSLNIINLYLDYSNISNLDFIDNLPKLKLLVLDNNKRKLITKEYPNITILYENYIKQGDENNG